ncbi:MAG TPA: type II secretion system F family protein [Humisphaera sp.]
MDETTLLILCGAGAVACAAFFVLKMTLGREEDSKLRDRLTKGPANTQTIASRSAPNIKAGIANMFVRAGQAAAQPFMPKNAETVSKQRQALARAGIYSPGAIRTLNGAKVILFGVGIIGGYIVGFLNDNMFMSLSLGGLAGYLGPRVWLGQRTKANQRALTFGLPDALDLMVVCVEAGLTVDAAMQRVGQELGLAHPAIAREFGIAHMETRVGLTRGEALKNIGVRTGCQPLQSLAAMLVQADRFGTSIAQALRVFAETLRNNRQAAAEEQAAKASVKISFPLVLFIFPSTFIVLCGPVIIELMNSSLFK